MNTEIEHEAFDVNKRLEVKTTLTNVLKLLDGIGKRIRFDEMRGRVVCADIAAHGHMPDGTWTDTHTIALLALCEARGLETTKDKVQDALTLHAKRNSFNGVKDWLWQAADRWDHVERVDRAMVDYWGAADQAASIATGRIFLLSIAARGLEPGCKVDTCPIFIGGQGSFKSTALLVLAGGKEYFGDSPLPIGTKDAMQSIRGKLIWEIGENAGMASRDQNLVKAFLSAQQDTFRASYGRFDEDVPRTCVFAATSNEHDVLHDSTGGRRNLPVKVTRIDIEALQRDRDQLLGEAAYRVIAGEQWWPTEAEDAALNDVRQGHQEADVLEETIEAWIAERERQSGAELEAAASAADLELAAALDAHELQKKFTKEAAKYGKAKAAHKEAEARERVGKLRVAAEVARAAATAAKSGFTFTLEDLFAPDITDDLGRPIKGTGGAIPTTQVQRTKPLQMRVASILRGLGWERGKQTRNAQGARERRWTKNV